MIQFSISSNTLKNALRSVYPFVKEEFLRSEKSFLFKLEEDTLKVSSTGSPSVFIESLVNVKNIEGKSATFYVNAETVYKTVVEFKEEKELILTYSTKDKVFCIDVEDSDSYFKSGKPNDGYVYKEHQDIRSDTFKKVVSLQAQELYKLLRKTEHLVPSQKNDSSTQLDYLNISASENAITVKAASHYVIAQSKLNCSNIERELEIALLKQAANALYSFAKKEEGVLNISTNKNTLLIEGSKENLYLKYNSKAPLLHIAPIFDLARRKVFYLHKERLKTALKSSISLAENQFSSIKINIDGDCLQLETEVTGKDEKGNKRFISSSTQNITMDNPDNNSLAVYLNGKFLHNLLERIEGSNMVTLIAENKSTPILIQPVEEAEGFKTVFIQNTLNIPEETVTV